MSVGTNTTYGPSTSTTYQRELAEKTATGSGKVTHTDFLKLLTKQLTSQDPLNPSQDIDFTAQLAQLQALDEQMAMTKTMQNMRIDTQLQAGTAMIGKYINGTDDAGKTATGMVERLVQNDGDVYLELTNKQRVAVGSVTNIWNDAKGMLNDISNSGNVIGMWVEAGIDKAGQPIRGIVEKVQVVDGQVQLKLFGGQSVTWSQVTELREATTDEVYYTLPDEVRARVEAAQKLQKAYVQSEQADGTIKDGIVVSAELDPKDYTVYLVMADGSKIDITKVTEDPRTPTAEEAAKKLGGKWVTGMDEDGNALSGLVIGATDNDDGLSLTLAGGKVVYYDTITEIRDRKDTDTVPGESSGEKEPETTPETEPEP